MASNDKKALALIRSVENRAVWLAGYLVARSNGSMTAAAAKLADEGLDHYQTRFDAISVKDLPDA